jgi:hypothetical protein
MPDRGKWRVAARSVRPDSLPAGYEAFTQTSGEPQECQGGPGHNSWYGNGRVDALSAITGGSGNG